MKSESVVHALLQIWDEMPQLAGDAWGDLFVEVRGLLDQIAAASTDLERGELTNKLLLLIRPHRALLRRLRDKVQEYENLERLRHPDDPPERPMPWHDLKMIEAEIDHVLGKTKAKRFTDIRLPKRMIVDQVTTVEVSLSKDQITAGRHVEGVELFPIKEVLVYLVIHEHDFEALDGFSRVIKVGFAERSETAIFKIKPVTVGDKKVRIDLSQDNRTLLSVRVDTKVARHKEPYEQTDDHRTVALDSGDIAYLPPPDVEIRVEPGSHDDKSGLTYLLSSPSRRFHFEQPRQKSPYFKGDVQEFRDRFLKKLERFFKDHETTEMPPTKTQRKRSLDAMGEDLFRQLFERDFWKVYQVFKEARTVHIVSDEPWPPWELIKPIPPEDVEDQDAGDFFCNTFQVTRWLDKAHQMSRELAIRQTGCIVESNEDADLVFAAKEIESLRKHLKNLQEIRKYSELDTHIQKGSIELWHFALHGKDSHDPLRPFAVILPDGTHFDLDHLPYELTQKIRKKRPLFFFNACYSGKTALGLSRLIGWPPKLIRDCGASAFLGPLWPVHDQYAHSFADHFYQAIIEKKTIGEAAHHAREQVRIECEKTRDPSWAAFVVYAHPYTRLIIEDHDQAEDLDGQ